MCKLKKSIYSLKQGFRGSHLKFNDILTSFEVMKNDVEQCIYMIISVNCFMILVLYVNDIFFFANNNMNMLTKIEQMLLKHLKMKDLSNALFVLGIKMHHNKFEGILSLF